MKAEFILLRFGELTLKGKNRHRFENRVLTQVHLILKAYPNTKVKKTFGRIIVQLNGAPFEAIAPMLQKVFGLVSFSPVLKSELELESIQRTAYEAMQGLRKQPSTFKVSTRRAFKDIPYDSQQLNYWVGGYVLSKFNGLKVDVHRPEVELKVEIREEGAYIYSEVIPGSGGFPEGSNGKGMLMLSGGIDSPVAGWLAMKRGIRVEAVHFYSYPFTSERAKQKVIDLTRILAQYTKTIKLHLVPFTDIQTKLNQHAQQKFLVTLMRRSMFRITERLAEQHEAQAIVTGESLGQVASQTLSSLNVIGRVTKLPILQPLITMDKTEIITIAKAIDTYSTSILPYEDCCTIFLPKSPSTNPNLSIIEQTELGMEWLAPFELKAVEHVETLQITQDYQEMDESLF